MEPIRIAFRAADPAMMADLGRELEALRGQEPPGAELVDDPAPRTRVVDPLLATVALALVMGVASGAGKKLGETVMAWLIERIRRVAKRRKSTVTLTVADQSLAVDEHTDPAEAAATLAAAFTE